MRRCDFSTNFELLAGKNSLNKDKVNSSWFELVFDVRSRINGYSDTAATARKILMYFCNLSQISMAKFGGFARPFWIFSQK